jgi:hypothetical protein
MPLPELNNCCNCQGAALRGVHEELGLDLDQRVLLERTHSVRAVGPMPSPSYPGLSTVYTVHEVVVDITTVAVVAATTAAMEATAIWVVCQ